MTKYTIAVVEDTINVLETFLQVDRALSLADVIQRTGLVKNKAFRILATLSEHQLVIRDEESKYALGPRFLAFGEHVQEHNVLVKTASQVMDWLVEETQETIFLGVVDDTKALVLAARESPQSVRLFGAVGRRAPLHTGGVPKVLLAFLPQEEREAILNQNTLDPITSFTMTDHDELVAYLETIREQGYAVTAADLDLDAVSIAAPIYDATGKVTAAMSIAGPVYRFPEAKTKQCVNLILQGTERVSQLLGHKPIAQSR